MLILTILNFAPQVDTIATVPNTPMQNEVSLSTTPSIPPPPSMIAYWELNENCGTVVSDSIVPYVTGTTYGDPRWVPGIAQSGLEILEGQFIDFKRPSYLYLPEVLTIEAWVNLRDPSGLHTIIMNAYNPTNIQYHFGIQDGHLYFDRQAGAPGNEVTSMASITPGQWHHVVVVMNWGLRRVWFYLDGVDDEIYPYTDVYTGPSGEVTIGADRITGAPSFLNGSIDEVAIYNDMLDQSIINEHYQKGLLGLGYLDEMPVNEAPVAIDDSYIMVQYDTMTVDAPGVLENDIDNDGDILETELVSDPTDGMLTLSSDGGFTYEPLFGFSGIDSFEYRAFDGVDYSATATVMITVEELNTPPVSLDDEYFVDEDGYLSVTSPGILENDYDYQYDIMTAEVVDWPAHGDLYPVPDGGFDYIPDYDWCGIDTFTYRGFDGQIYGNEATVTINVNPVNDAPVAYPIAFIGNEDVVLNEILPVGFDEEGDVLQYIIAGDPAHGDLILDSIAGAFSYTPDPDWFGVDSFGYQVFDGELYSNIATVTIEIIEDDDTTGPEITITFAGDATDASPGMWTVVVFDPQSGVDSVVVEIDGVLVGTFAGDYLVPNTLGIHIISVTATNADSNNGPNDQESSTFSHSVTIVDDDVTAPDISITYTGDMTDTNPGYWTVSVSDPESGVYSILVEVDGITVGTLDGDYPVPSSAGFHTITVTAVNSDLDRPTDQESIAHSGVVLIEQTIAASEIVYLGDISGVYSDPVYLEVLLLDATTHLPLAGKMVEFTLGTQSAIAVTDVDGLASVIIILDQEPGVVMLVASFVGDADYLGSTSSTEFVIYKECATILYSGTTIIEASEESIILQATVFDDADGYLGNLSLAYVTFTLYLSSDPAAPVYISYPVRVQTTGLATIEIPNLPEGDYPIIVSLLPEHNRFYCSPDAETATITIYEPERAHAHGAGVIVDADGHRGFFVFKAKYTCGGNLKGFLMYTYIVGDWVYLVRSCDITGFVTDGNHGFFEANGTISGYNFETHTKVCSDERYRIRVDVFDNWKNHEKDVFQIRVFDSSGLIEYEAGFDPFGYLLRGCIVVKHGRRH